MKKKLTISDEHKEFIKENYLNKTHKQIADELKISVHTVRGYCFRKGYKKYRQEAKSTIPEGEPIKKVTQYSNISREEIINKYLNMNI
jgi:orotate phosphoribosyltransferase-like protein